MTQGSGTCFVGTDVCSISSHFCQLQLQDCWSTRITQPGSRTWSPEILESKYRISSMTCKFTCMNSSETVEANYFGSLYLFSVISCHTLQPLHIANNSLLMFSLATKTSTALLDLSWSSEANLQATLSLILDFLKFMMIFRGAGYDIPGSANMDNECRRTGVSHMRPVAFKADQPCNSNVTCLGWP